MAATPKTPTKKSSTATPAAAKKATPKAAAVKAKAPEKVASAPKPAVSKSATAAAKKPAVKKTTAKKAAIARGTIELDAPKVMLVTDEQRYRMIAEAAYYRAESNNFRSDSVRDWIEAEKDIAALLSGGSR